MGKESSKPANRSHKLSVPVSACIYKQTKKADKYAKKLLRGKLCQFCEAAPTVRAEMKKACLSACLLKRTSIWESKMS